MSKTIKKYIRPAATIFLAIAMGYVGARYSIKSNLADAQCFPIPQAEGGMYATDINQAACQAINPLTGGCSCPAGMSKRKIFSSQCDADQTGNCTSGDGRHSYLWLCI